MQDYDAIDQLEIDEQATPTIDLTDGPVYNWALVGSQMKVNEDRLVAGSYSSKQLARKAKRQQVWAQINYILLTVAPFVAIIGVIATIAWVLLPKFEAIKWDAQRKQMAFTYITKINDYKANNGGSAMPKGDGWYSYSKDYVLTPNSQFKVDPATELPYGIKLNLNAQVGEILAADYNAIYIDEARKCNGSSLTKAETDIFAVRLRQQDGTVLCNDNSGGRN